MGFGFDDGRLWRDAGSSMRGGVLAPFGSARYSAGSGFVDLLWGEWFELALSGRAKRVCIRRREIPVFRLVVLQFGS